MDSGDWVLPALNAIAAALLLNSGVAKTVAPGPARRAIEEIIPVFSGAVIGTALRVAAAFEIAVAAVLPVPALRIPVAIASSMLGAVFIVLGLLGIARRSKVPCGCFGTSGARPLGLVNVLLGLALALTYPINATWSPAERYPAATLLSTSILSLVLCLYMRRELVVQLVVPRRMRPAESEAH